MTAFSQQDYELRFEWGRSGVEVLGPESDVVIVVDILSFSTCVDIALSRGATVYPYCQGAPLIRVRSESTLSAADFAGTVGARLAVPRRSMNAANPYSLSPVSFVNVPSGEPVVLPSPNGAALSLAAAPLCEHVLTACLRNASAVADRAASLGRIIAIIAAGEQWAGHLAGLRPAIEDLLGAGAVVARLTDRSQSPEAMAAGALFRAAETNLSHLLRQSVSGRELAAIGFDEDIRLAAELDVSSAVPVLRDGAFVPD